MEDNDLPEIDEREKKAFVETLFNGDDHNKFLTKLRRRFDRAGVEIPKIEVRYENLSVEGNVRIGRRARSTLLNATINILEAITGQMKLTPLKMKTHKILKNVSGIVRPSRMTLLLGPPSAGKTTLLLALAGKLDKNDVKVSGTITYNGEDLNEFVPKRTCAYISQNDLHYGEMTVRETLDFSRQYLGVGSNQEMLDKVSKEEDRLGIEPDVELDAFMKATSIEGQNTSMITDYVLQILGLDICADTFVGDDMRRGISGGEKKRLTIGEMLVGPAKFLLMDGISTGLDSSTTFRICKYITEMVHIMDMTTVISLLQPTPETYELFDDIILLSEGQIVYQGDRDRILDFFEYVGFKCPGRKAVADFLQEVTSMKDQEQYWSNTDQPYEYVSVTKFVQAFQSFKLGQILISDLRIPYDKSKSKSHPNALVRDKYGISKWKILRTCFAREWLLMKRNAFLYIFKSVQITIMSIATMTAFFRTTMKHETTSDGEKYLGAIFFSLTNFVFNGMAETTLTIMGLPVFYKQRDALFYPAWAYALPVWVLRIPISFMESAIWAILTYYTIGYAPAASRFFSQWLAFFCIHQMALSLFRFFGAVGRTDVIANAINMTLMLIVFVLGGFIIAKDDLGPWIKWGYYLSPLMYGQHALVINEFFDDRWSTPNRDIRINETTVGQVVLASRDFFDRNYWYWISIGALLGFSFLFNLLYIAALSYLNPIGDAKAIVQDNDGEAKNRKIFSVQVQNSNTIDSCRSDVGSSSEDIKSPKMGMVLPFQPLSLAFNHINYYVDTPSEMKSLGYADDRLQLLQDVSGAFKPGILTALVGVTGAGKTTLMDVLSGRKTSGYIDGNITVSGYPKNQDTFARICGYCEQLDIHSPNVTVYESLLYSTWLRLSSDIDAKTRQMFVEEVMKLIELEQLKDAIVGLPGKNGLSSEQRKRLTIAVELVANPSIIFMDEPTSGLDARAAAIVMRTVRNTVNTGRTVVCTIHQPSIDIFESFDELLLMKRGGRLTYAGPLGHNSHKLVEYFEAIPGVPKIKEGYNPATWMLDITSPQTEVELNLDYAEIYATSSVYKKNQEVIEGLSTPFQGSEDIHFPTKYSQPFVIQFRACFWKQHRSYWQNPSYNGVRFFMMTAMGVLLGIVFFNRGSKMTTQQDLMNFVGVMFSAILFLGGSNALNVQAVVASERTVFYRERAAGMYSALPFALAQLIIEMIYLAIGSFIYAILMYSMIGFEWTIVKCFYFYYYIYMCFLYYSVYGMMLISLTPRPEISAILMTFFVTLWNLFAGFLLPKTQIPTWWRWYYWASPVAWTMYGLVTSQVGDKTSLVEVPEAGSIPLNIYLKQLFGYDHDFLPFVAIAHLGWIVLFFVIFAYGIKIFNFQKR